MYGVKQRTGRCVMVHTGMIEIKLIPPERAVQLSSCMAVRIVSCKGGCDQIQGSKVRGELGCSPATQGRREVLLADLS